MFDPTTAVAETIRHDDPYRGVRVTLTAHLATARLHFHVDVNLGDPIHPPPQPIQLPSLLHGNIELLGYPLPMVLAEKIATAVQRGQANTRWRDYADLYLLSDRHQVDGGQLHTALAEVATHRQVTLRPLGGLLQGYARLAQSRWAAWRRRQRLDDRLPEPFEDLLTHVLTFTDPVLGNTITAGIWRPTTRRWTT